MLKQAPGGQACAYKGMGKCPAPCDGSASMDQYYRAIAASVEFARGTSGPRLAELHQAMHTAASNLQFERAARIREQIDRARKVLAHDERLQKTIEGFRYLVVQRGGGTTAVRPFFVDRGRISAADPVQLGQLEAAAIEWTDKMRHHTGDIDATSAVECSECLWLVSHFLVKGDEAPGLFLHESQLSTPYELAEKIRSRFGKPSRPTVNGSVPVDPAPSAELE